MEITITTDAIVDTHEVLKTIEENIAKRLNTVNPQLVRMFYVKGFYSATLYENYGSLSICVEHIAMLHKSTNGGVIIRCAFGIAFQGRQSAFEN